MHPRTIVLLMPLVTGLLPAQQSGGASDWRVVEQVLGRPGTAQAGGVMRFAFPRADLSVTVGTVHVRTPLALTGWTAFLTTDRGVLAMGDLVLLTAEVAPVMRALQQGGIEATAVHNHLIGEEPRIVYMHIMAMGDAAKIAGTLRAALALTGTPLTPPPPATAVPFPLDTLAIAHDLGATGRINGGVYQVSVPRHDTIVATGMAIPPSMGLATVINIQALDGTHAAATGDFVLTADQVNAVTHALVEHGLMVTAVHSHLLASTPTLLFVHFWGEGQVGAITAGLGEALAASNR